MNSKEYSAKTVDEAITKACIDLGMSSDQIDIEVVNEGSTGFLGFGSKPAVIRVRQKTGGNPSPADAAKTDAKAEQPAGHAMKASEEPVEQKAEETAKTPSEELNEGTAEAASDRTPEFSAEKPAGKQEFKKDSAAKRTEKNSGAGPRSGEETAKSENRRAEEPVERTDEEIQTLKDAASGSLSGVFGAMDLPVDITMEYEPEDDVLAINFDGEDMGILIGKRGQTLDSLQYLTSLVVNRVSTQFVRVKLDTEDYRKRRKETLENLANNIARKVKKTGHPVSLEPMNPYERRIIHSCLQGNRYVETYSEGTEPYRHVVISPIR